VLVHSLSSAVQRPQQAEVTPPVPPSAAPEWNYDATFRDVAGSDELVVEVWAISSECMPSCARAAESPG
jgi:hypothetical protein